MKIILGSQAKGRKKILGEMGYEFDIIPANIDEKAIRNDDPKELTLALARAKAQALKKKIKTPAILITSDQVVLWNGIIREKPESESEVREFLEGYALCSAETITAVLVTNLITGKSAEGVDTSKVYFYPFTDAEITEIIKNPEVYELSGAFDIEGKMWKKHIKRIEGTRESVIGLPRELTLHLINAVKE